MVDPSITSSVVLVERSCAGDPAALDALLARYRPRLTRWAHGRLPKGSRSLLETADVVQEVLIACSRRLDALRASDAFPAYLRRALVHRLRDEARRQVAETSMPEGLDIPDPAASPVEEVMGRDFLRRYEAALGQLSERERAAIVGRAEWGLSYRELALELDASSADAARMLATRALARLTRLMAADVVRS